LETPAPLPPDSELLTTYNPPVKRRIPLHTKILIGLLIGAGLGLIANLVATGRSPDGNNNGLADWLDTTDYWVEPVGKIFLRLMFMVVVPLVVSYI
jgi:DAACS family dicarboxylate/amino acid:cation (Na+ or H+) symporter